MAGRGRKRREMDEKERKRNGWEETRREWWRPPCVALNFPYNSL